MADEVETIIGIVQRHLQSSLYSDEERRELLAVVTTALCSSRENPFQQLSELVDLQAETKQRMTRTALLEKNTDLACVLGNKIHVCLLNRSFFLTIETPLVLPTLPTDEALCDDASSVTTIQHEVFGTKYER